MNRKAWEALAAEQGEGPLGEAGNGPSKSSIVMLAGVLILLYLLVRIPLLMVMPIFGDEAIYLRWGQLIQEGHWWVSLVDPKPPVHFWLIGLVMDWTSDPLRAARLLSVAAGAASIPLGLAVCGELSRLLGFSASGKVGEMAGGRLLGLIFVLLMIFSPFFAFYQRLATADALFVMEMLACVWLSLRWGRRVVANQKLGWTALWLGVAMGVAMMTRQGVSYVLWGIPFVALAVNPGNMTLGRRLVRSWPLVLAMVVAGAMWFPYLIAKLEPFAAENGGTVAEVKRRILYQSQFTEGDNRLTIMKRNAKDVFIPTTTRPRADLADEDASQLNSVPQTGWFWYYLTPPVYIAGVAGLGWMAFRRQWRILVVLLVWMVLILGPIVLLGSVVFSRYTLAGAVPLVIGAAYLLIEAMAFVFALRVPAWLAWGSVAIAFGLLLMTGVREISRQQNHWNEQTLTQRDRYQYITGWTAGTASMRTVEFVKVVAKAGPLILITDDGWGTPSDALWVYLKKEPSVKLYYISKSRELPIMRQADATETRFLLRKDKWTYTPEVPVSIGPDDDILYITGDPIGKEAAQDVLRRFTPNLSQGIPFYGIEGDPFGDRVTLFRVR